MTTQPTIGKKMHNGFIPVAIHVNDYEGVVLAVNTSKSIHEFATWRFNTEQGERSTWAGHYTNDELKARKDYVSRTSALFGNAR